MKGMLKAEIVRFCNWRKIALVTVTFVVVLLAGQYENIQIAIASRGATGVVKVLWYELAFDRFKIILIFLLSSLYVSSFCQDDRTHYCRMILCRTDVTYYTQARFVVNMVGTVFVSMLSFFLAAGVLSIFLPLVQEGENFQNYYSVLANEYPIVFIAFMGMQFGLLAAAFGSIGLLLSAFQPDTFVCIAITGLVFFASASYIPNSAFNVLDVVSLAPAFTRTSDGPRLLDISWGNPVPSCCDWHLWLPF